MDTGKEAITACVSCLVSGTTPPEERQLRLAACERGMFTVLCYVGMLTEGYDLLPYPVSSWLVPPNRVPSLPGWSVEAPVWLLASTIVSFWL